MIWVISAVNWASDLASSAAVEQPIEPLIAVAGLFDEVMLTRQIGANELGEFEVVFDEQNPHGCSLV